MELLLKLSQVSPHKPTQVLTILQFAYAGHFMFFILISEMKRPQDAKKAAWTLQGFATVFYAVFAVVMVSLPFLLNSCRLGGVPCLGLRPKRIVR